MRNTHPGWDDEPEKRKNRRGAGSELDIFAFLHLFLKRKNWIIAFVGTVMVITAVILLLIPNKYTSVAVILPSGAVDKMSQLKELAGISSMMMSDENSSELFPVILRSQLVSDAVLGKKYSFVHDSQPMTLTLQEYFKETNPDKLRRALARMTSIATDKKTGVITVGVETEYPAFSQQILTQYLDELESFNLHKRRSQAKEKAKYLARQLEKIKRDLEAAEDSLEHFQLANRDWASSTDPEIIKMLSRLQREVELQSKTYLFLQQEYQIAKLDAQKDVPIVRILDAPTLPIEKSGPKRRVTLLIIGMLAFFAALAFIVVWEALRRRSVEADKDSYRAFKEELHKSFPRVMRLVERRREEEYTPA